MQQNKQSWLRRVPTAVVLTVSLAAAGCASYMASGLSGSTTPMLSSAGIARPYTIVARDTGVSKRTYFLFLRWGKNLVREAVDDAVQRHGGDGMINVTVDTKFTNYVLFHTVKTLVEGDIIKFETASNAASSSD